ncbi:hypothetical protein Tco_0334546, partial [Tanacetum coccineum]
MDSNPSQPLVLTLVNSRMHKEAQKSPSDPTSFGVTGEYEANPQFSSGMSAFNSFMPTSSAYVICHYESASGNDASAASTAEADPGTSTPYDSLPTQQGKDEGTKTYSLD